MNAAFLYALPVAGFYFAIFSPFFHINIRTMSGIFLKPNGTAQPYDCVTLFAADLGYVAWCGAFSM